METFLGPDEDMSHIALVTSITKGVASGLQQSSSGIAGLLATVSTKYVEEKFGAMLQKKGSLVSHSFFYHKVRAGTKKKIKNYI